MLLKYLWSVFNTFLVKLQKRADPKWDLILICIITSVCYLLVHSYLPRIIAASFCRGLTSSHTATAGTAFKWAEVWKWRPWCFTAGKDCGNDRNLQGNSGGPGLADLVEWPKSLTKTALPVLWQLMVCALFTLRPVCLHIWRHSDRFTGRKQKRLLKTLTQRSTIFLSSALPHLLCLANILLPVTLLYYSRRPCVLSMSSLPQVLSLATIYRCK